MAEQPSLPYYLPIAGGRIIGFIPFSRVLVQCEMQSVSARIWTRGAVSISYDDNDYTTGPITFLPMMRKIWTVQIQEEIYDSNVSHEKFLKKEKGCSKWARVPCELLYTDKHIHKESKTRRKHRAMVWIDDKNASDMAHESWIIDCLKVYKISSEVIKLILPSRLGL